jgi:hypothetical protein
MQWIGLKYAMDRSNGGTGVSPQGTALFASSATGFRPTSTGQDYRLGIELDAIWLNAPIGDNSERRQPFVVNGPASGEKRRNRCRMQASIIMCRLRKHEHDRAAERQNGSLPGAQRL